MMGRSVTPDEFSKLLHELDEIIDSLMTIRKAFKERMKEESPIRIGDKVQLWGGGLWGESYKVGVFYVRSIHVWPDGSFKYLFYNCKKDGTKGRIESEVDYSEIERLEI